jgi:hypothetical protein
MRFRTLILVALLSAMCLGGSFTCIWSDDDDGPTTQPWSIVVTGGHRSGR